MSRDWPTAYPNSMNAPRKPASSAASLLKPRGTSDLVRSHLSYISLRLALEYYCKLFLYTLFKAAILGYWMSEVLKSSALGS